MQLHEKELTGKIIGAAMEVHRKLGHGFHEVVYYEPFGLELTELGLEYAHQPSVKISYKGRVLAKTYEPDYTVEQRVLVEAKALDEIGPNEEAQLLNYLRATGYKVGFIINFGTPSLQWKRMLL